METNASRRLYVFCCVCGLEKHAAWKQECVLGGFIVMEACSSEMCVVVRVMTRTTMKNVTT